MPADDVRDDATITRLTRRFLPGWEGIEFTLSPLPGGGSDRRYWRLKPAGGHQPPTAIYMHYTARRPDNLCFLAAADLLAARGVSIPARYADDPETMSIWLEDLGNIQLWDYRHDDWAIRRPLYEAALREAVKIHAAAESALGAEQLAKLQPGFDAKLYAWEQNYFFDQFLARFSLLPAKEVTAMRNAPEFAAVRNRLAAQPRSLVHRDFQSQNILVRDGQAVVIDFQGLRPGRPEYDLASLLYDPYVQLSPAERDHLAGYYLDLNPGAGPASQFFRNLADAAVQRLMQALGAYGFLSTALQKTHFLTFVPRAAEVMRELVGDGLAPKQLGKALAPEAIDVS
jgi:aminoglycoside/choline kinase family phosphotransferase